MLDLRHSSFCLLLVKTWSIKHLMDMHLMDMQVAMYIQLVFCIQLLSIALADMLQAWKCS